MAEAKGIIGRFNDKVKDALKTAVTEAENSDVSNARKLGGDAAAALTRAAINDFNEGHLGSAIVEAIKANNIIHDAQRATGAAGTITDYNPTVRAYASIGPDSGKAARAVNDAVDAVMKGHIEQIPKAWAEAAILAVDVVKEGVGDLVHPNQTPPNPNQNKSPLKFHGK